MTKNETRMTIEIRKTKFETSVESLRVERRDFAPSFEFRISIVVRISSFGFF